MRPAQAVFQKALGTQENPFLLHKGGLDEHQLQKLLAAGTEESFLHCNEASSSGKHSCCLSVV